jgi:pimeloyl-ACP methyl ester carboxylesterase
MPRSSGVIVRTVRRWATLAIAASLVTCVAGIAPSASAATDAGRDEPLIDKRVVVHGARLHVRCVGQGATTVVLIAGFSDGGQNWGAIEPTIAKTARVCSYARFGDGTSDLPPRAQTFATQAGDLRTLLRAVNERGPYVVVGHSYGGAEAVTFASLFTKQVRGLLLIDASPVTWLSALCAVADDGSEAARSLLADCARQSDPAHNLEHLDGPAAFAAVAKIDSLGRLPMRVTTASSHEFTGLDPAEATRLNDVWNAGQDHWTSLSSAARLVSVDNTSHYIQSDQPAIIIAQIQQLLGVTPR